MTIVNEGKPVDELVSPHIKVVGFPLHDASCCVFSKGPDSIRSSALNGRTFLLGETGNSVQNPPR